MFRLIMAAALTATLASPAQASVPALGDFVLSCSGREDTSFILAVSESGRWFRKPKKFVGIDSKVKYRSRHGTNSVTMRFYPVEEPSPENDEFKLAVAFSGLTESDIDVAHFDISFPRNGKIGTAKGTLRLGSTVLIPLDCAATR